MFEGMDTSYNLGGGFLATQDTADKKGAIRGRNAPWIPVLTKDIHDLLPGQDSVRRGTHESAEVTLVGIIRSSDRNMGMATIEYMLDDNSGPPLSVSQMIQDERQAPIVPVAEKTYVRVIGKTRTWGNNRGITAFAVIPLTSLNEWTMHQLEVTYCRLFYAKDIIRRHEERAMDKPVASGAGSMALTAPMGGASTYSASSRTTMAAPVSSGLTGLNGEIHKFLSTATSESGYSVADIRRRFTQLSEQKIREHLDLLASEGHVYTTIDDDHYRTTDS